MSAFSKGMIISTSISCEDIPIGNVGQCTGVVSSGLILR